MSKRKQAIGECRSHAVRGANVYPLEFTGTSDPKVARQYLDMTEGNLGVAVATYVDREVHCSPPSMVRDANASLVSLLEDLDSDSDEFTSKAVNILRVVPCVSLSLDDGDQKLPAARPAVLSTAAISSFWDDDHDDGSCLNEINGDQKLTTKSSNLENDGLVGLRNNDLDDSLAMVIDDDNYEIMFEGKTYHSYKDYVEAKRSRTAGIFADSGMLAARLAIAEEMTTPGPLRAKNPRDDLAIPPPLLPDESLVALPGQSAKASILLNSSGRMYRSAF